MIRRRPSCRSGSDTGSTDALGLALLAPAAIGLALVILLLGRGVDGRATAQSAAESAAQAAAQERTPEAAVAAANAVASAMLVDRSTCSAPTVRVDTTNFRPGGIVAVTVSCTPSRAGLEAIGAPAPATTSAAAFARIDPLRATGDDP